MFRDVKLGKLLEFVNEFLFLLNFLQYFFNIICLILGIDGLIDVPRVLVEVRLGVFAFVEASGQINGPILFD